MTAARRYPALPLPLRLPPDPLQFAEFRARGGGRGRGGGRRCVVGVLGVISVIWGSLAQAQPLMQTIITNGPVSNRLNIVVLSEAYTTNVLGQYLVDATNAVDALLGYEAYAEYAGYFNALPIK